MPNTMFSNKIALKKATDRIYWKVQETIKFLDEKYSTPEDLKLAIDKRNIINLMPMLVDVSAYDDKSEDEKREYFRKEADKIASAFYRTHDKDNPHMPDFKAVEPYLRRMYETVRVDNNIDWDDEHEIENLYSFIYLQQSLGTVASDFAGYFTKTMSEQERRELDMKCLKADANINLLKCLTVKEDHDISRKMNCGTVDVGNRQYFVEQEIAIAVAEASKDGSGPVVFDPASSEILKNYFLGNEFEIDQTGEVNSKETYDEKDACANFYNSLTEVPGKSCFDNAFTSAAMGGGAKAKLLMINGKPVDEMYQQEIAKGLSEDQAKANVGLEIRNALTDGKSIVSMMRPMLTEAGKVTFKHQEMKVDLDKLNEIDRKENYSGFRRFLDVLHIYRIPKLCPTNKERDQAQAAKMADPKIQDALRAAEDKFIEQYNINGQNPTNVKILNAFPKISRPENVEEKNLETQKVNQEEYRQKMFIDPKLIDGTQKVESEPTKEIQSKMLDNVKGN